MYKHNINTPIAEVIFVLRGNAILEKNLELLHIIPVHDDHLEASGIYQV